jgi:hypothetical protein
MFDLKLFLGFPVSGNFQQQLKKSPSSLFTLLIGNNPAYLEEWEGNEGHFIGKRIGKEIDLDTLRLAEANIYSLLERLVPNYPIKETPLILFSIVHD